MNRLEMFKDDCGIAKYLVGRYKVLKDMAPVNPIDSC